MPRKKSPESPDLTEQTKPAADDAEKKRIRRRRNVSISVPGMIQNPPKAADNAAMPPADGEPSQPGSEAPVPPPENPARPALLGSALPEHLLLMTEINKPVFPGIIFPLSMGQGTELNTMRKAYEGSRYVGFILCQKKEEVEVEEENSSNPGKPNKTTKTRKQLYRIGTVTRILRFEELPDGNAQILCQGHARFELHRIQGTPDGLLEGEVTYPADVMTDSADIKALCLAIMNTIRELIQLNPLFSEEMKMVLNRTDWSEPAKLADFAMMMTSSTPSELQEILETLSVHDRLEKVLFVLKRELNLNQMKEDIKHKIEEKMSNQQREFFLREQLKTIKQELHLEEDSKESELERYRQRFEKIRSQMNKEAVERCEEELKRLQLTNENSPEFAVSRNYLDWLTALPWGEITTDRLSIEAARKILDRDHYGLQDVKKRILEFIAVSKLKGQVDGSILCFAGPPGVGKTSLGQAIAKALNRKFFRFSVGGMRDESEIKGHRRTYVGALPGKVINAFKIAGSMNPVILLDEVDKMGTSYQGDPASALLEVLDPEQNQNFRDHFLDVPFDLSKVLFIATANNVEQIPPPLLDRMELITLSGYTTAEKLEIGRRHLIPKLCKQHGLTQRKISFGKDILRQIIDGYARESGVRSFEKQLATCMRKTAFELVEHPEKAKVKIDEKVLREFLGRPRDFDDELFGGHCPGVATGLAWTAFGGTTLNIEALALNGPPEIRLTGHLGDVMKESMQIAYSFVSSQLKKFACPPKFFASHKVHLHVPAGATPKDGPSAGITMATALISLASRRIIPKGWAMTGELSLTGQVLPVGGIKEKLLAAKRAGLTDIILPQANQKDYEEIDAKILDGLTIHYAKEYSQVYQLIFT